MKLKPALAALALAASVACSPAYADDLSEALSQAREYGALAHSLRTAPTREDLHAAAMLLEMQACYELNAAVMDASGPIPGAVQNEALACLQRLQRIAGQ